MEIRPVVGELFYADGQTDMTMLIVASRNFANAPKYTADSLAPTVCTKRTIGQCSYKSIVLTKSQVTDARQLYLPWKFGLTFGSPMRNLMAKLWVFSHVLLKDPFMTVSLARSQNGLTSSHLKAAQWIGQALDTDRDLLLTAKLPFSKELCSDGSSLQIPA
jgi:hypothetical protein